MKGILVASACLDGLYEGFLIVRHRRVSALVQVVRFKVLAAMALL